MSRMSEKTFAEALEKDRAGFNAKLESLLPMAEDGPFTTLRGAMRYALLGGGKRVRGLILLQVGKIFELSESESLPYAAALEMIHASSLVHDDLPALDNDDFRRGQASCHKAFGEGQAILAGDALLNMAMELLIAECHKSEQASAASAYMAGAAGQKGMLGGQSLDLLAVGKEPESFSLEELTDLQKLKTGKLLQAAYVCPALRAGADKNIVHDLQDLAENSGMCFQIRDDLLDEEAGTAELGKTAGKDRRDSKITFVTVFGRKAAEQRLAELEETNVKILASLEGKGLHIDWLYGMQRWLSSRRN